ncbi:sel1 repeat family protein [Pseudoxanthomonas suwonensis]|uniref:sel1 repeat family protein n=1 Tax=Pseudoxanthomonas suwonensis TaxID=314722 RepID=UPI0006970AAB|nr:sel1 repeat family protein [Pseudoxanthomonas suwonensis]
MWLLAVLLPSAFPLAAGPAQPGAVQLLQWEGPVERPTFGNYVGEPDIAPELLTEGFLAAHPDIRWRREGLHAFHHQRYEEAHVLFRRAAGYADKASMAMLAEMYWKGLGVARDRPIGYAWMDLAAERLYPNFTILRERYWGELSAAEQQAAIERGQALLAEFGDDVAKPRLERVLRREGRQATGSRTGSVGFVRIVPMTGPMAGKGQVMRAEDYYRREYWDPERYWAWQDEAWKAPQREHVEVGDVEQVRGGD